MLGGGNPVGSSNPTGIGQGLNFIGKHVYAYSGEIAVSNSFTNLLKFRLGQSYVKVQFNRIYMEDEADSRDYTWRVKVNGQIVYQTLMYSNAGNAGQGIGPGIPMIFAPFDEVIVEAKNVENSESNNIGAMFVGEHY